MSHSLYVHIPFCLKRCIYCDFVSAVYDPVQAAPYIEALKKELLQIPADAFLSTLYIGGGTPTALDAEALSNLLLLLFNHFNFNDNYEATIEANPGTIDSGKLRTLRSSGMNRISIGVQSFQDCELSLLGRIHTGEEARQAVLVSKDAGFENIGIDLIYGIPGQSIDSWKENLETAVSLKPQHISTYELTVEKGTVLYTHFKNPPSSLFAKRSSDEKIIEMYEYAIDYLTSQGFIHYEISNFAEPGYFSRHNLNYWDRGEYYGAGLGAHSFIKEKRFYNADDLDEYTRLVSENRSPVKGSETITNDRAAAEAVFLGMRKIEGIHVEAYCRRYKRNLLSHYQKEIAVLQDAGLIEGTISGCSHETSLKLTRKGLVLSNEVFEKFI